MFFQGGKLGSQNSVVLDFWEESGPQNGVVLLIWGESFEQNGVVYKHACQTPLKLPQHDFLSSLSSKLKLKLPNQIETPQPNWNSPSKHSFLCLSSQFPFAKSTTFLSNIPNHKIHSSQTLKLPQRDPFPCTHRHNNTRN